MLQIYKAESGAGEVSFPLASAYSVLGTVGGF